MILFFGMFLIFKVRFNFNEFVEIVLIFFICLFLRYINVFLLKILLICLIVKEIVFCLSLFIVIKLFY